MYESRYTPCGDVCAVLAVDQEIDLFEQDIA